MGITNSFHSHFLVTGSFHNPGPYAGYIMSGVPLSLGIYWITKQRIKKNKASDCEIDYLVKFGNYKLKIPNRDVMLNYLSQLILVLVVILLPSTQSRAAFIGMIIGCLYMVYSFRRTLSQYNKIKLLFQWPSKRIRFIAMMGMVLFLFLGGYLLYLTKKGSADGRILMWRVSTEMIKDKPLLGWGVSGFEAHYGTYQAEWFKEGKGTVSEELVAGTPDAPFNEIVRVLVSLGGVGFVLSILLFRSIWYGRKKGHITSFNGLNTTLKGGVISILVFSMFSYTLDIAPMVVQLLILSVLLVNNQRYPFVLSLGCWKSKYPLFVGHILGVMMLILIPFLSSATWRSFKGYQSWKEAYDLYRYGVYDDANKEYEHANRLLPDDGLLCQMYGKSLQMNEEYDEAKQILLHASSLRSDPILSMTLGQCYQQIGEIKQAETLYWDSWYMIPHKFYPKYLLAKLYQYTGEDKQFVEIANELLSKKMKVKSKAIEEMRNELIGMINNVEDENR
ncbi:O-antigen ligase family protein [Halosquirtibacter laminarini]|uniref:O-antigen ligase family protein n=1 Tax=Halosquirtibacter laminarini TaxID=3374600 RepID=A0AC61NII9_9BACT|nr:O-antigen ligase family protein [Prolixibacteraceae bacterium]